jgi:1-deoxy-D-xylulose-5-phosphate synthase
MGDILCEFAENDERVCAITAAMCDGTGLVGFREKYRERFFDVGIAEEHALTFAAGLAANRMRPYTAIYSTFLQRGYDNIIHDIALQKLPCVICVDRAGLNSGDGATHHGIFDVAFLSQIPNLRIYTPTSLGALRAAMNDAMIRELPCAIRYPSGCDNADIVNSFYGDGKFNVPAAVCDYQEETTPKLVIITDGRIVTEAMAAKEQLRDNGISVGIILLEMIKPYSECADNVAKLLPEETKNIIFLEEEIRSGGMGMNLSDTMARRGMLADIKYEIIAVDDNFVDKREKGQSVYSAAAVDCEHIVTVAKSLVS